MLALTSYFILSTSLSYRQIYLTDPLIPSAAQRAHVLDAALLEHERRTGAREFVPSGAVGDDRFLRRDELLDDRLVLFGPGQLTFERQQQRASHMAGFELLGVPRVDDDNVLRGEELLEILHRNTRCVDRVGALRDAPGGSDEREGADHERRDRG